MKNYWCKELAKRHEEDDEFRYPIYSALTLTRFRERLNLDQIQCAHFIGVNLTTYRSWEGGRRNMPDHLWKHFIKQFYKAKTLYKEKYPMLPWPPGRKGFVI